MKRALALIALVAAATGRAQSGQPLLAGQEARIAAGEARAAAIDRAHRRQTERLARADAPTAELLAALQRAASRPPLASLAEPGSIADALERRAILAAALPALAARTADLRRDVATLGSAQATARDAVRQARLRLAELVETLRGGDLADAAGPSERQRLAALPAPALRPAGPVLPPKPSVYGLPLQGRVVFGTGEAIVGRGHAQGLTLAADRSALVRAPAAGRVGYAGPFGGYGRIVILDHGRGWTSLLAGLGTTSVSPGARLDRGAPVGRMPAAPSRLTLELKRDGRTVDVAAIAAWRGG